MAVRLCLFLIISTACCTVGFAQKDDCEITLTRATEELDAGHFYGIDSLLMPCLKGGFSREQRQRAYLLLTQVYLLLDDADHAKSSYLNLLRANPEFVADPARDPIEIVYLSKKFTASPIFTLFARAGGNTSFIRVIKSISVTGEPTSTQYKLKPGWTIAVGGDWNIDERKSLSSEVSYSFMAYEKEQTGLWSTSTITLDENQNWVKMPILFKYSLVPGKKVVPYCYGGLGFGYLFRSNANPTLIDRTSSDDESETPSRSPIVNYNFKRNSFHRSLIVGAGVRYKSGLHYLVADLRYSVGLTNLVDYGGTVYDYSQSASGDDYKDNTTPLLQGSGSTVWRQASVDDFFRMDNLYLTLGYQHQLYKPRELKKAKTKSVLRNIKKSK